MICCGSFNLHLHKDVFSVLQKHDQDKKLQTDRISLENPADYVKPKQSHKRVGIFILFYFFYVLNYGPHPSFHLCPLTMQPFQDKL